MIAKVVMSQNLIKLITARGEDIQHRNSTGFYNNAEVRLRNNWSDRKNNQNYAINRITFPFQHEITGLKQGDLSKPALAFDSFGTSDLIRISR